MTTARCWPVRLRREWSERAQIDGRRVRRRVRARRVAAAPSLRLTKSLVAIVYRLGARKRAFDGGTT